MNKVKMIFRLLLGAFMTYAGLSHLTFNRLEFVAQVPMWLRFSEGFTDFVVLSSGVVEIALGLSMLFLYKHKSGSRSVARPFLCSHLPWKPQSIFLSY